MSHIAEFLDKDIKNCTKCSLYDKEERTLGIGGRSRYFIVDIAPVSKDSLDTISLLSQVVIESGIEVSSVYFTHIIKCSVEDSREVLFSDARTCISQWLMQEVVACGPQYIVCLGDLAYNFIFPLNLKGNNVVRVLHPIATLNNKKMYKQWLEQWKALKN